MQPQLYWLMPIPIPQQSIAPPVPVYLPPPLPSSYLLPYEAQPLIQYQAEFTQANLLNRPSVPTQRKHVKRRTQVELNKCYKCPYANCYKDYASDLALNLHMKNKHRGGNKKERDRAAKMILKSEMEGRPAPKCNVHLPPGYIEANKIRLLLLETEDQNEVNVKEEQ